MTIVAYGYGITQIGVPGDLILLSEGLSVEVMEMPDVTVEQEITVLVASGEIDVEVAQDIQVEVPC